LLSEIKKIYRGLYRIIVPVLKERTLPVSLPFKIVSICKHPILFGNAKSIGTLQF